MMKFIFSFQSFFFANQSQTVRSGLYAPTNKQNRYSDKTKREKLKHAISLQHMAREVESSQPNLASELRSFASR